VAFLRFIDTQRKVERILACFALSGGELIAEVVLFYYGNAVPALRPYLVNIDGRFQSLAYLHSTLWASFRSSRYVQCSISRFTRRSLLMLGLTAAMFLPIIATAERAPLSAGALSLCVAGFFTLRRRYARWCLVLGIAGAVTAVWYVGSDRGDFATALNSRLGGKADPNSSLQDSSILGSACGPGVWIYSSTISLGRRERIQSGGVSHGYAGFQSILPDDWPVRLMRIIGL